MASVAPNTSFLKVFLGRVDLDTKLLKMLNADNLTLRSLKLGFRWVAVVAQTTPLRRRRTVGLLHVRGCKESEVRATRENGIREEVRRERNERKIKRKLRERQGKKRKGVRRGEGTNRKETKLK
jgi:hypothetical protein